MKYLSILVELMWVMGVLSFILAFALWLFHELPTTPGGGRSLFDRGDRREELREYRDPKIKFGGYVGILKKLVISGVALMITALLLRLFVPIL